MHKQEMQTRPVNDVLDVFLDRLFHEKGIYDLGLEESVVAEMKSDQRRRIENRLLSVFMTLLNEKQQNELSKIVETEGIDKVHEFLNDKVTQLDDVIANELLLFRADYLS